VIRSPIRSVALLAASTTAVVALLTGCGAGQVTQTEGQRPAVNGLNVDSPDGRISLRDLSISYKDPKGYPQGGAAPLQVWIFNRGDNAVRLTGVTSDAGPVVLSGASAMPSPTASTAPAPAAPTASVSPSNGRGSGSPTGSAPTSAAPTSAAPSSPAPVGNPQINIEIPARGYVALVPDRPRYLQLAGISKPVRPTDTVKLTFRFDNGTSIDTDVSVAVPMSPLPRSPIPLPAEDEGH